MRGRMSGHKGAVMDEILFRPDPGLCVSIEGEEEGYGEVPGIVITATTAGIEAFRRCAEMGWSENVCLQFAGVAFKAVIEMEENARDRDTGLMKYGFPSTRSQWPQ